MFVCYAHDQLFSQLEVTQAHRWMFKYSQLFMAIHIIYMADSVGLFPPPLLSLNLAGLFLLFQHSESQSVNLVAVCQLPTKHRPDSLLTAPWSLASPHCFSLHVTFIKSRHPSLCLKEMLVISCSVAAASLQEVVPKSPLCTQFLKPNSEFQHIKDSILL